MDKPKVSASPTGTAEASIAALEEMCRKQMNPPEYLYSKARTLDSDLSITHRCDYNSSGVCRICNFHRGG